MSQVGVMVPGGAASTPTGARRAVLGVGTPECVDPYLFHEEQTPAGNLRINAAAARIVSTPDSAVSRKIREHVKNLRGLTRTTSLLLASRKLKALLDNGADISAIEAQHVPDGVAIYALESGFSVSVANDQSLQLVGLTFLKFRTPEGRKLHEHPFFVVEKLNCQVILGVDFLERHELNWKVRGRRSGLDELTWVVADGTRLPVKVHKNRPKSGSASLRLRLSNISVMTTAPMAVVTPAKDHEQPDQTGAGAGAGATGAISRIEIHAKTPGRGIVIPPRGITTLRVDTQIDSTVLREEYVLRPCEDALAKLGLTGASAVTKRECLAAAVRIPIMNPTEEPVTIPDSMQVATCYALESGVFDEESEPIGTIVDEPLECLQAMQDRNRGPTRRQAKRPADTTPPSAEAPTSSLNW